MITKTKLTGHELKVWEHGMIHLRASGPCSLGSLQHWFEDQTPGVDAVNSWQVTNNFIRDALQRGVVETEKDGGIIYVYMKDACHV